MKKNLADIPQAADHYSSKMLIELYSEACAEETGVAYESLNLNGVRTFIVTCFTREREISLLERNFDFSEAEPRSKFEEVSILELVIRCGESGITYEDIANPDGSRNAIILAVTRADYVNLIELLLNLKPSQP
ncbi:hypothetical protein [Roseibacillus persicicus]|uniref:hypothetical protein n=1 Tax=Roseibacillus persicicus TaxID=454148 RepID=UPI002810CD84|nr:hypothetical protein [Roseibacillus persicicus]